MQEYIGHSDNVHNITYINMKAENVSKFIV